MIIAFFCIVYQLLHFQINLLQSFHQLFGSMFHHRDSNFQYFSNSDPVIQDLGCFPELVEIMETRSFKFRKQNSCLFGRLFPWFQSVCFERFCVPYLLFVVVVVLVAIANKRLRLQGSVLVIVLKYCPLVAAHRTVAAELPYAYVWFWKYFNDKIPHFF